MMSAAGCPSLLMTNAPQETWGQAGTWLVPSEARAQAPICGTGVFLLTRLKLWDLEHTLGCRDKVKSTKYAARQTVVMRSRERYPWFPLPREQPSPPTRLSNPSSVCWVWPGCPRSTKSPSDLCPGPGAPACPLRPRIGLTPSPISRPLTRACLLPLVLRAPGPSFLGDGNCHRSDPISSRSKSRVALEAGLPQARSHPCRRPAGLHRLPPASLPRLRIPGSDFLTPRACAGASEGCFGVPIWILEACFG